MVEANNLTKFSVDKRYFLGVAKKVLKGENKELENLSIAFVNSGEMKKVNKKYRGKDKPTDVLSFQRISDIVGDFSEVIICPEVVKEKALILKESFKKEMTRALVHGILHALGYEHEISNKKAERMEKKEEYYIKEI